RAIDAGTDRARQARRRAKGCSTHVPHFPGRSAVPRSVGPAGRAGDLEVRRGGAPGGRARPPVGQLSTCPLSLLLAGRPYKTCPTLETRNTTRVAFFTGTPPAIPTSRRSAAPPLRKRLWPASDFKSGAFRSL